MKVKDVVKFVEVAHKKQMPKDVREFVNSVRKDKTVGEMDFVHFVRAVQKDARE
tara:strand:- start:19 stop:180 length:162 start_codon:yes stop_codon:yes gene_type:complete